MTTPEILKHLEERVKLLQAKVTNLSEQRTEIERQIEKYRELIKYYRAVYEAEAGVGLQNEVSLQSLGVDTTSQPPRAREGTLTSAVFHILSQNSPMRIEKIAAAVVEKYPEIAKKTKNLTHTVEATCFRGYKRGIYERVEPRCYGVTEIRKEDKDSLPN